MLIRFLPLLAMGALLAGCTGPFGSSQPAAAGRFASRVLIVENPHKPPDSLYEPNPVKVRVGQIITWVNKDSDPHDVTALDGQFASGPIPAGGTWRWVFIHPGTYQYTCTIHPRMHGEIIVYPKQS